MKKFLLSFIMIICACTFVFAGCGAKGLKDNPETNDPITGNGGYAVRKGDYLYYVNGFVDDYTTALSDYKKDNVEGKVVYGAIYRTKLTDNKLGKDERGFLQNSECVVSKVVGYDQGGFYIVGDYIYYATPYMRVDADGVIQNTRISFNRIKIDGTKNKEFYVTEEDASGLDWRINVVDEKAYLTVKYSVTEEESSVVKIKTLVDNGKKFKEVSSTEGVTEVVFDDETNQENPYYFYTRPVKEDEAKQTADTTVLVRVNYTTDEEVVYYNLSANNYKLIDLNNDRLYFTNTDLAQTCLYSSPVDDIVNQNVKLSKKSYTSYYTIDEVPHTVIAVGEENKVVKLSNVNGNVVTENMTDGVSTIVTIKDNYIYHYESNVLYRTSLVDGTKVTVSGVGEVSGKEFLIDNTFMAEVDGRYVYVYAKYTAKDGSTTSYYLNRIDTLRSEMVAEFVGVMTEEHMVKDPNLVEDDEEGEDSETEEREEIALWV